LSCRFVNLIQHCSQVTASLDEEDDEEEGVDINVEMALLLKSNL
jgi:hypothetical protein